MAAYQPLSPASGAYTPVSPRYSADGPKRPGIFGKPKVQSKGPTGPIDPNSRIGQLLAGKKEVKSYRTPFQPVHNWRAYYDSLLRCELKRHDPLPPHIEERLAKIKADHEKWEREHPVVTVVKEDPLKDVPKNPDHVVVRFRVLASGKVKAYVGAPMSIIQTEYFNKGVKPPVDVYLKALKNFGYPNSYLEKVLANAMNADKKKAEMEAVIDRVFGKYSTKTSKPKAKPVKDQIKSKFRKMK